MLFFRALQLNKRIKQQRVVLTQCINLKGIKDPQVLELSQKLDKSVLELQKIILKVKSIENNELYLKV